MKPVLVILTGHAPDPIRARHGDFPAWFRRAARLPSARTHVINVAVGESLPGVGEIAGAIITGSGAMVTDRLPWSEQTAGWIRDAMDVEVPLFGVCFGHQLMTHALGGRVDYLPDGREIGTQPITVLAAGTTDAVISGVPAVFRAHTTHEQFVLEAPGGATVLARSARDPHQVVRYGKNAISTQFHPEFSADVMRAYVRRKFADTRCSALQQLPVYREVAATPVARALLRQFAQHHGWATAP